MSPEASPDTSSRSTASTESASTTKPAHAPKEARKELDRAKMPPPPLPITNGHSPAPPRMARMPSLSEISSHLHIPSPLASASPNTPPRPTHKSDTSPLPPPSYTASPSGRLKLPASAMTRKRSGSITQIPSFASLSSSRTAMERRSSGDNQVNGESSKVISSESVTNSPMAGVDVISPPGQQGSLKRQPSREYVQGYKDVPSLEAIRHRVSFSQGTSGKTVDEMLSNNANNGDVEKVETLMDDGKRRDSMIGPTDSVSAPEPVSDVRKGEQHPLAHPWTLYFDAKGYIPPIEQSAGKDGGTGRGEYEKSLLRVGRIDTVEGFARHMNNLRLPSQIKANSNYHLFKGEIRPMWEDPSNHEGGKWVVLFRQAAHLLDIAWANLTMALIGQILDPDDKVCGIVASNRPRGNRLQIWTRGREDVADLNELGKRVLELMGIESEEVQNMSLEYQYNASNAHPPPNAFMYIPFANRSFTPSTPSRLGSAASPNPAHPTSGGSGMSHLSPSTSSANPSPTPVSHPIPLHPRPANLSINVTHSHNGPSPLSNNTRAENRPNSPAMQITPTPSPKMMHHLPRAPEKSGMTTSQSFGSNGGTSMRRLGSGQGSNAFAGPMASAKSSRGMNAGLTPPSPVSAYGG